MWDDPCGTRRAPGREKNAEPPTILPREVVLSAWLVRPLSVSRTSNLNVVAQRQTLQVNSAVSPHPTVTIPTNPLPEPGGTRREAR